MNLYSVNATGKRGTETVHGRYTIQANTKGDAILEAQKRMGKAFVLTRTEEALVRVEFDQEEAR